mgnify:CR=1 FL=1
MGPHRVADRYRQGEQREPFAYLEVIAAGHPQNRIDELPHWNFHLSS